MVTNVFVDTWLLRAIVSEKASERADAKHELSKLNSNSYRVSIPQIALGEVVSVIMRDFSDPNTAHTKLNKLYDSIRLILDVATCLPSPTVKSLEYALELKNKDNNLRETDLLIVAQALVDPDSQRLLTPDKDLLESQAIRDKEKSLRSDGKRNERLKIVDGL